MNTGKTARGGMVLFVGIIFALAVIIAGIYVFLLTPGESSGRSLSNQHFVEDGVIV